MLCDLCSLTHPNPKHDIPIVRTYIVANHNLQKLARRASSSQGATKSLWSDKRTKIPRILMGGIPPGVFQVTLIRVIYILSKMIEENTFQFKTFLFSIIFHKTIFTSVFDFADHQVWSPSVASEKVTRDAAMPGCDWLLRGNTGL